MAEDIKVLRCECGYEIGTVQGDLFMIEDGDFICWAHAPVECRCSCGRVHTWEGKDAE